jgi:hypothetical protein
VGLDRRLADDQSFRISALFKPGREQLKCLKLARGELARDCDRLEPVAGLADDIMSGNPVAPSGAVTRPVLHVL